MHTENEDCAVGEILRLASLAQDDTSSAPVCRRAMFGATGPLLLKEKAKGRAILESRLRGMGECGRLTAATTTETSIVPRLPRCDPEEVKPTKDPDGARQDISQCTRKTMIAQWVRSFDSLCSLRMTPHPSSASRGIGGCHLLLKEKAKGRGRRRGGEGEGAGKAKGRGRLLADDQWSSLRSLGGGALQAEGEDGAAFRAVRGFDRCAHRFGGLFGDGKSNAVQAVLTFIE